MPRSKNIDNYSSYWNELAELFLSSAPSRFEIECKTSKAAAQTSRTFWAYILALESAGKQSDGMQNTVHAQRCFDLARACRNYKCMEKGTKLVWLNRNDTDEIQPLAEALEAIRQKEPTPITDEIELALLKQQGDSDFQSDNVLADLGLSTGTEESLFVDDSEEEKDENT